jgi:myo-inositol-1(or 4)-monophosphatase
MSALPEISDLKQIARDAGQILKSRFGEVHHIRHKGTIDIVTEADGQAEDFILDQIRQRWPDHRIVAEESGSNYKESSYCWYVDPLDGTVNFAHGLPIFSTTIALAHEGQVILGVVYDPIQDEMYHAQVGGGAWLNQEKIQVSATPDLIQSLLVTGFPYDISTSDRHNLDHYIRFALQTQGVRRLGSAALDLCYIASGRMDGYWELDINAWDVAAGILLVKEAGGMATSIDGGDIDLSQKIAILAANPAIHSAMSSVLHDEDI